MDCGTSDACLENDAVDGVSLDFMVSSYIFFPRCFEIILEGCNNRAVHLESGTIFSPGFHLSKNSAGVDRVLHLLNSQIHEWKSHCSAIQQREANLLGVSFAQGLNDHGDECRLLPLWRQEAAARVRVSSRPADAAIARLIQGTKDFVFVIFAAVETFLVLGCALGFFFNMGFERDWKKIEAFVGSKMVIQVYETQARLALEFGDLFKYNQCQSHLQTLYVEGIEGSDMEFSAYNLLCVIMHSNNNRDLVSSIASIPWRGPTHESSMCELSRNAYEALGRLVVVPLVSLRIYRCVNPHEAGAVTNSMLWW
ncbi:SAC3 family protein A [Glycine soja]|uniref:SAC3 family protein A n=1 Tax=Glycine soja TaxID=3848 RepID=A0A445M208_GLYSO|nr:SAC3 family protein A [Glycine soja]